MESLAEIPRRADGPAFEDLRTLLADEGRWKMAVSREFEDFIVGQLESAGAVTSRRMFGGVGLYIDGAFCAIIGGDSGSLYLKVDDSNRSDYEALDMEPFRTPKGTMSYYTVPAHVIEDPTLLRTWALKAHAVAAKSKPARKRARR